MAKREVEARELRGFKRLRRVAQLLGAVHEVGCERDKAGNRELHFDDYVLLVLLCPANTSGCTEQISLPEAVPNNSMRAARTGLTTAKPSSLAVASGLSTVANPLVTLANGLFAVTNGLFTVANPLVAFANGLFTVMNGLFTVANGFSAVHNGLVAATNGFASGVQERWQRGTNENSMA